MTKNYARGGRQSPATTFSIAGWLFADLLFVLALIFLTSEQPDLDHQEISSPIIQATNTLSPTSTKKVVQLETVTPLEIGLGEAHCYNVELGRRAYNLADVVRNLEKQIPNSGSVKAGLVLVWTHATSIQEGVFISRGIGEIVRENFPNSFESAQFKSLGFSSGNLFLVQLEIYFFNDTDWTSRSEVPCLYNE